MHALRRLGKRSNLLNKLVYVRRQKRFSGGDETAFCYKRCFGNSQGGRGSVGGRRRKR